MQSNQIAIALGSGGARGIAHIGVLQALSDHGVEPDIVCGSSMGALVGAFYCIDQLDGLAQWLQSLTTADFIYFLKPRLSAPGGVVDASRMISHFRQTFGDPDIEQLPRRFAAVATNLNTGQEVWLQSGKLWEAVRASIALPGVITPVAHQRHWLADGGLVNPVPVSVCRALGAQLTIAVNLNGDLVGRHLSGKHAEPAPQAMPAKADPEQQESELNLFQRLNSEGSNSLFSAWLTGDDNTPSISDVLAASLNVMQDRVTRSRLAGEPPDIMIRPRLSEIGLMDYEATPAAIKEGRRCVDAQWHTLEFLLERQKQWHQAP